MQLILTLVHIIQEIDISTLPPEYGYADGENAYDVFALSAIVTSEMDLLEDTYIGGRDYRDNKIVIDIYGAYTEAFDGNVRNSYSEILLAIEKANDSYNDNRLPIEVNLVEDGEARGYIEVSISDDLDNLQDLSVSEFNRVRAEAEGEDADVLILFTHYSSDPLCGQAADILVDTADSSYAVVRDICIDTHTFAHELGHLQGARHNHQSDPSFTTPFSFGHGWYDLSVPAKTVMSVNSGTCVACPRQGLWSDPFDSFIGSTDPAGTTNTNWNGKVLFSTGPHIASLRGTTQTYDDSPPTGAITISPTVIIPDSTVLITTTFNEEIHPNYTPKIIIIDIDDGILTTADMTKISETVYTHSHTLTTETGIVDLSFSTARDIYGNDVVTIPTNGESFTIIMPDTTAPRIDSINRQDPLAESTADSTLVFRVTFDEDVTGVDQTDFETGGIAISSVTGITANSATQYDVDVSVTSDGIVSLGLKSTGHGIADTATTLNPLTNITPKTTAQTYTVTLPDTTPPVITLTGVNPQTIELGDGYTELGATTNDGSAVTIDDSAFVDAIGSYSILYDSVDSSGNNATQVTRTVTVSDTTSPVITLTSILSDPTDVSPIPITINFDETISGFTISDIVVSNGMTSNFTGSRQSYSVDITPITNGEVTIDIPSNVVQDTSGNGNHAAVQFSIIFETNTAPTVNDLNETTDEDIAFTITLSGSDADSDSLTFAAFTLPSSGTLSVITGINDTSASITYAPNSNFYGD